MPKHSCNHLGPRQNILIGAIMSMGCTIISAQGFYSNSFIDGSYVNTTTIAYGGYSYCGGMNTWSSLNGNYTSGWAPVDLTNSAWAVPGTDYIWSIGFSFSYPDPISGSCSSFSFTYTIPLHVGLAVTGYTSPSPANTQSPVCTYSTLFCVPGTSAVCTGGLGIPLYLNLGYCPRGITSAYLTLSNGPGDPHPLCSPFSADVAAYSAVACGYVTF